MQIYPILKEFHWSAKPYARHQPFHGIDRAPMPVIGYGFSEEGMYRFLTVTDRPDQSLEDLHAEAVANLASVPAQWQQITPTLLTGSGQDMSAEMILSPAFMAEARRLLQSDAVQVAIPRRTVIYACSATPGSREYEEFANLVLHTWLDDSYGNAPITNLVLRYEGDRLVGAAELEPIPASPNAQSHQPGQQRRGLFSRRRR